MRNVIQFGFIALLLVTASCSSTRSTGSSGGTDNSERDGSSFEKAIIVNSISEEYAYIRKVCPGCTVVQQSLVFNDKKPYDVIDVKKPDGKKASYYFDISKFFGKGF